MAPEPHSKAQQLLKGRFGRGLMIAEVATFIGAGVLYYKLTTDANARAKMEKYAPAIVMDSFHQVTGGRYRDSAAAGGGESGSGSAKKS